MECVRGVRLGLAQMEAYGLQTHLSLIGGGGIAILDGLTLYHKLFMFCIHSVIKSQSIDQIYSALCFQFYNHLDPTRPIYHNDNEKEKNQKV